MRNWPLSAEAVRRGFGPALPYFHLAPSAGSFHGPTFLHVALIQKESKEGN
jgi:hypothetical protein